MTLLLIPTYHEAAILLGREVAAPLETGKIIEVELGSQPVKVALCGFGLAAAGAGAAWTLAHELSGQPSPVILAGIAGTFDPRRLPIGSVLMATAVRCHGIGIGQNENHRGAEIMDWRQGHPLTDSSPVGDEIRLRSSRRLDFNEGVQGKLLSVAAACASPAEAADRSEHYPDCLAEDMESFAVALAARLARRPLIVLRGISNRVGERDRDAWRTEQALAKLMQILVAGLPQWEHGESPP